MKKFRVISDLHLDINERFPINIDDDIFTVVCGDTSGSPTTTIEWIKSNIKYGVGVSGNHLPYNREEKTIQELRKELANTFSLKSNFTYLDVETGVFKKEVDGILFLGSCFYSNMRIKSPECPKADVDDNKLISYRHMNDYRWGITYKKYDFGPDEPPTKTYMTPADYVKWSENAFKAFDKVLTDNESLKNPKPVVLITHYPLVKKVLANSFYVDRDNWCSYGNDMQRWLKKYPSIKCHCCGHCHDMKKTARSFYVKRKDGSKILVVNNSRGYLDRGQDATFNPNRFVNVETWKLEEIPESNEVKIEKEKRFNQYLALSMCFI